MLERRSLVGGACVTEALWPGYKVSTASYVVSLLLPEVMRDLELERHGYRVLKRSPSSFTPLEDGRYLFLGSDQEFNRQQIAKFSPRDAGQFRRLRVTVGTGRRMPGAGAQRDAAGCASVARGLEKDAAWASGSATPGNRSSLYQAFKKLGDRLPEAIELLAGSAPHDSRPPVRVRRPESDACHRRHHRHVSADLRARHGLCLVASRDGLFWRGPRRLGLCRRGNGCAHAGDGRKPPGSAASRSSLTSPVEQDRRRGGKAVGVRLEDGRHFTARRVASNVDAHLTFEKMLDPSASAGAVFGGRAADRLRQRQHEDQSCRPRAARISRACPARAKSARSIGARSTSAARSTISNGPTTTPSMASRHSGRSSR